MTAPQIKAKPQAVRRAEWALWLWTIWYSLSGIYETRAGLPDMEKTLIEDYQGLVEIDPQMALDWTIYGYGLIAVVSAFFIFKIAQGKNWARKSFLWGFIFQSIFGLFPPYDWGVGSMAAIPDYGLQIYALYLLYTNPGRRWFIAPRC